MRGAILLLLVLAGSACQSPGQAAKPEVIWHRLGSWSGAGNVQTESFESSTGSLRVRWKTTNETTPGTGTFELTINSSISGRPLQVAVDRKGIGGDTAYVQEDPRVFFAEVKSANVEWAFTIEEAVTSR